MGISVSSGLLRLQIPEESEDQEFVELGTRLIEGDVVDNRASMIQVSFSSCLFYDVWSCYSCTEIASHWIDGSWSTSSTLERVHSRDFAIKGAWFLASRLSATCYPKIHVSSLPIPTISIKMVVPWLPMESPPWHWSNLDKLSRNIKCYEISHLLHPFLFHTCLFSLLWRVCLRAQGSLASADFGLPGKKTFTFYHIKSSSEVLLHTFLSLEYLTPINQTSGFPHMFSDMPNCYSQLRMDDIPKLLEEYKTLL